MFLGTYSHGSTNMSSRFDSDFTYMHSTILLLSFLSLSIPVVLASRISGWTSTRGLSDANPQTALNQLKATSASLTDQTRFYDCLSTSLPDSCDDLALGHASDLARMQLAVRNLIEHEHFPFENKILLRLSCLSAS